MNVVLALTRQHVHRLAVLLLLLAGCQAPDGEPLCPEGQVQDEATEDCVPEHCGEGPWGLIERDEDTVHVAPWGDNDGDGSEEDPFSSIQDGADEAGQEGGELVAVAAGTYPENLTLGADHDEIQIAGRCAGLVIVDGTDQEAPTVQIERSTVDLQDLSVTGGQRGIEASKPGLFGITAVTGRRLLLKDNYEGGLVVLNAGTSVELDETTIRDTQWVENGTTGRGINIQGGASLIARDLLLEDNHDIGLFMSGEGTTVELERATIRSTQPESNGTGGRGLSLQLGAQITASDLLVEDNHEIGIGAASLGTEIMLDDAVIRNTRPLADGTGGFGIVLRDSSGLLANNLVIEDCSSTGLLATESSTSVDLQNSTIRNTQPDGNDTGGEGIIVSDGAVLAASGLVLDANHSIGLVAIDAATSATLEGSTIAGTRPLSNGVGGRGVSVLQGARVVADGLVLENNQDIGLYAMDMGTSVELINTTVRDTQPSPDGSGGRGISLQSGVEFTGRNLEVLSNHEVGLFAASPATTVLLEDSVVGRGQLSPDGTGGTGVYIQEGAALTARRLAIEQNQFIGLHVEGAGTTVDLEDTVICDTQSHGPDGGGGLNVLFGATLTATRLLVTDNHAGGLTAAAPGTTVNLLDSQVLNTHPLEDGRFGRGISVMDGASLVATDLTAEGNHDLGIGGWHQGTTLQLTATKVRDTHTAIDTNGGVGIYLSGGAQGTIDDLEVEGGDGPGIYVAVGGSVTGSSVTLAQNGFAGAVVNHGQLTLRDATITEAVFHPNDGGGLGILGRSLEGASALELENVSFDNLPGSALYLRGNGSYQVRNCTFSDTGDEASQPGGVLAVEGVTAWHEIGSTGLFSGLLLEGNEFTQLPGDAILLDNSSAMLASHPETGEPNLFSQVAGEPLVWQRCSEANQPEILDASVGQTPCSDAPRILGPLLEFWLRVDVGEALD